MLTEGRVFDDFARRLVDTMPSESSGRVFLASSVGGIYAGSPTPPFRESTPPHPLSAYGETKLAMEQSLRGAIDQTPWRAVIGRITNLYGSGQDLTKGQGLLSVIVDSSVSHRPLSVYVSLDTLRDYIHVDDCARVIVAAMRRLDTVDAGSTVVKIIGSMNALSIGAILGEVNRLRRSRVPLVLGQGDSRGQALDLRVRSEVWTELQSEVSTTLPAGLSDLFRARLAAHISGQ